MTSPAPLPALADLATACAARPDDQALAAPWQRGAEAAFWFSRGAWAMRAVALWWGRGRAGARPRVWLPDYFCNASTAPLRDGGAELVFYPIGAELEPDWPACEALAAAHEPDLLVLVHYFGTPADGARAKDFCRAHHCVLIEDAAHVAAPTGGIGSHGDFVFYSPHKLLAVPDGALLLIADDAEAEAMNAVVAGLGRAAPAPWTWLAKRLVQKALPGSALAALVRRRDPGFDHDPPYAPLAPTPAPSPLARRLLGGAGKRLAEVAAARGDNARDLLAAVAGWPGCHALAPAPAPYRLAVRCDDAPARFARLRHAGCPVETWPDLAPEVWAAPRRHARAVALRRSLLLLPVHQSADARRLVAACV